MAPGTGRAAQRGAVKRLSHPSRGVPPGPPKINRDRLILGGGRGLRAEGRIFEKSLKNNRLWISTKSEYLKSHFLFYASTVLLKSNTYNISFEMYSIVGGYSTACFIIDLFKICLDNTREGTFLGC